MSDHTNSSGPYSIGNRFQVSGYRFQLKPASLSVRIGMIAGLSVGTMFKDGSPLGGSENSMKWNFRGG